VPQGIPPDGYNLFTASADSVKNPNKPREVFMLASAPPPISTINNEKTQVLRAKAAELEAAFLAEMLAHAGFGEARESFGGGIGEDQFASFLRTEQAKAIVEKGGIGLSEHFFRALIQGQASHA
jgi:peptidoglycan hydrolase FlgJ